MHCCPQEGIADADAMQGEEPEAAAAQLEEVMGPVEPVPVGALDPPPEPPDPPLAPQEPPPDVGFAELHAQTASAEDCTIRAVSAPQALITQS